MLGLHSCAAGEMKDDVQKLEFTIKAFAMEDPFANDPAMHDDIRECLAWQKSRSAEAIMRERESVTQLIEKTGFGCGLLRTCRPEGLCRRQRLHLGSGRSQGGQEASA